MDSSLATRNDESKLPTEEHGGRNSLQHGSGLVEDFFNKNTVTGGDRDVEGQLLAEASQASVGTLNVGYVARKPKYSGHRFHFRVIDRSPPLAQRHRHKSPQ